MTDTTSRRLKQLGMLLFLLGLLTGFAIMVFKNPRMGLAAHLEGVMNGTFLVVAGLIWNDLSLGKFLKKAAYWTLVFGTFANWFFTTLGGIWGTSRMTPIAGAGHAGNSMQEALVSAGLAAVGLTMVFALAVIVYGLRAHGK